MNGFEDYNPFVITLYFFVVAGITMFSTNPVIFLISFLGAIIFFIWKNGSNSSKMHLFSFGLFAASALINPLISHNGVTVLFVMNNNPVTLEALIYGIFTAVMIISVLYWFRTFSQIMTSDKLLYVFGIFSPKIALLLSMSLRYIPLFAVQAKKVNQTQKAMGLYKEDNIIDSFKGGVRVFSVMVTWALENGIITADSMSARGYGVGKRSHFSLFRFKKTDILLLILSIILPVLTVFGISNAHFTYYPAIGIPEITWEAFLGYISYGILTLLPTLIDVKETLKWQYLKSKI